jgi:hypothetical protein
MANDTPHLRSESPLDRDALRERLRKMSDIGLRKFGRAARNMSSPDTQRKLGDAPKEVFAIQLG